MNANVYTFHEWKYVHVSQGKDVYFSYMQSIRLAKLAKYIDPHMGSIQPQVQLRAKSWSEKNNCMFLNNMCDIFS